MAGSLTEKQQRLLDYFQSVIAEEGAPPSLRRAASDLEVSHAAVAQGLKTLEEKGYVKRDGDLCPLHVFEAGSTYGESLHGLRYFKFGGGFVFVVAVPYCSIALINSSSDSWSVMLCTTLSMRSKSRILPYRSFSGALI